MKINIIIFIFFYSSLICFSQNDLKNIENEIDSLKSRESIESQRILNRYITLEQKILKLDTSKNKNIIIKIYLGKCRIYYYSKNNDNFKKIISICSNIIININNTCQEAFSLKGKSHYKLKQFKEAKDDLFESIRLSSTDLEAKLFLLKTYRHLNAYRDAFLLHRTINNSESEAEYDTLYAKFNYNIISPLISTITNLININQNAVSKLNELKDHLSIVNLSFSDFREISTLEQKITNDLSKTPTNKKLIESIKILKFSDDPNDIERYYMGLDYYKKGYWTKADSTFNKLTRPYNDSDVLRSNAKNNFEKTKTEEQKNREKQYFNLKQNFDKNPNEFLTRITEFTLILQKSGRSEEAIRGMHCYYTGLKYFNDNRWDNAIEQFERVPSSLYIEFPKTQEFREEAIINRIDEIDLELRKYPANSINREKMKNLIFKCNGKEKIVDAYYDALSDFKNGYWENARDKLEAIQKDSVATFFNPVNRFKTMVDDSLIVQKEIFINKPNATDDDYNKLLQLLILANYNKEYLDFLKQQLLIKPSFFRDRFKLGPQPLSKDYVELSRIFLQCSPILNSYLMSHLKRIIQNTKNGDLIPITKLLIGIHYSRYENSDSIRKAQEYFDDYRVLVLKPNYRYKKNHDQICISFEPPYTWDQDKDKEACYQFALACKDLPIKSKVEISKEQKGFLKEIGINHCEHALDMGYDFHRITALKKELEKSIENASPIWRLLFWIVTILFLIITFFLFIFLNKIYKLLKIYKKKYKYLNKLCKKFISNKNLAIDEFFNNSIFTYKKEIISLFEFEHRLKLEFRNSKPTKTFAENWYFEEQNEGLKILHLKIVFSQIKIIFEKLLSLLSCDAKIKLVPQKINKKILCLVFENYFNQIPDDPSDFFNSSNYSDIQYILDLNDGYLDIDIKKTDIRQSTLKCCFPLQQFESPLLEKGFSLKKVAAFFDRYTKRLLLFKK